MSMPAEHMMQAPTVADLLQGYADAPRVPVQGIASDSRLLRKGFLFLAVKGISSHGLDFIEQAKQAGVCAVAWDASTGREPADSGVPMIAVDGLAEKLGEIANRFYGRPSEHLGVIGVTGTNGKTTVAWMIAQAGELLDESCAYLGTLGYGVGSVQGAEGMTTPAAIELHGRLADFVDQGAKHAAIEVSSHALSQGRVDGVRFDSALFTNLSRDHLDYHGDMREYFESKARLFLDCDPRNRIINVDSEYGEQLAARCGQDVVTVSTRLDRIANGRSYVYVRSIVATDHGSDVRFVSSWGDGHFTLQLPGEFNVANAVLVLALLLKKGVPLTTACDVMSQVSAPPGRMQRVAMDGPAVFVDYAHTPAALEVALRALRAHCHGRLWVVFGCGGDRDIGKRPQMGKAAEKLADHVVITNDNPRSEDPDAIVDDIVAGLAHPERVTIIEDRAAAIAWTIEQAADADAILVAGKGHEDYQESCGKRVPFSDHAIARKALTAREGAR
jgi:UDP-N-acetylmuramoyl-L-alanyl-D-glutamate--2,6-diaminopimelate ligase